VKSCFKCAAVIVGLPNVAGLAATTLLVVVLARLVPLKRRMKLLPWLDVVSGVATILAGLALCRCFNINPTFSLPVISSLWIAAYLLRRHKYIPLLRCSAGIYGGWLLYWMLSNNF